MNRNLLSLCLLFLSSFLLLAMPAAAQEKCDETDYDCKIEYQSKLIAADKNDAEAYYARSMAYKHKEQWALAIKDLDKYLASDIKDKTYRADGLRERSYSRRKSNDMQGALADLSEALKVNPDEHESYYSRANIYNDLKQFDKAIADFTTYLDIRSAKPEYLADGHYGRAYSYNAVGKYSLAIDDLNVAILLNPTNASFYKERAFAYRKQGKAALAAADEAKAAELGN